MLDHSTQHAAAGALAPRDAAPALARAPAVGLDWLNLWVSNIQTGFGPFVAVYLTSRGWTQTAIGFALSLGTLTAMASQLPACAIVDATAYKSRIAGLSLIAFAVSALLFAIFPIPLTVYLAEILHGFSSCTLGPAVTAMSIAVAGQAALGARLGRNARFSSIGNGVGAALMGACGYYLTERAVFFLAAALALPALIALRPLARLDGHVGIADRTARADGKRPSLRVLCEPRLLALAACATVFTLSDSAMLPLAAGDLTKRAGNLASLLIATCIILPQVIVAIVSPRVGHLAQTIGRRPILMLGFATLPVRGLLFALVGHPLLVVAVQLLNGVASAAFLIIVPLVTSDVAGRSGHFNLALGAVGFAIGIGGTLSTTLAGWMADRFGDPVAFAGLAAIGFVATLLVWCSLPETRPPPDAEPHSS